MRLNIRCGYAVNCEHERSRDSDDLTVDEEGVPWHINTTYPGDRTLVTSKVGTKHSIWYPCLRYDSYAIVCSASHDFC